MAQFRLPDQPPVTWARISQTGEGGTGAAHIDGSGLEVYNYLMHTEMIPASASISLQTRLRAKLIDMNVGNPAFEGAAVLHRGFRMSGTDPNLNLDTQVWSSNPFTGGRKHWISGDTMTFRDYNFLIPLPDDIGIDYVTWELVVRAPGQIIIDDVQCRNYYGRLYEMDIAGNQMWEADAGAFNREVIRSDANLAAESDSYRWVRYLMTREINCRQGQNIITSATGILNARSEATHSPFSEVPSTAGFSVKLRRRGTSTEDWLDVVDRYFSSAMAIHYDETRQKRARYDYDRAQLVVYVAPHGGAAAGNSAADFVLYALPQLDLLVSDFIAPSQ